ncbi:glycine receptor subunit alpha-4-like isoform X2 [Portunus trituberculatus]|nr:glycine receptor subunit alpha-4-like isoform X2 [Portunus trituberculatus]
MLIQDINSINAADMDFRVDLFLHMTWVDRRLNLSHLASGQAFHTLPSYVIDHIWTPDPYVTNAKDAAITKLTTTYASVTLYRNHTIKYSARVYSTIACQMEFYGYPMDVQTCAMIMQSFMYSSKEVEFDWRKWSPVMINPELRLLQFSLKQPLKNYVNRSTEDELGQKVIQLVVELEFSREIGHHLVQTFVPSFLVVALSWFSFWLGLEAIPGRVTLLVTSLLTITTLFTGIKEGLPPVAYVKAIDVWMAGCMVFIFAALGEFVVVRVLNVMHAAQRLHPSYLPPIPNSPSISPPQPPSPSPSVSSSSFLLPPSTTTPAAPLSQSDKYDQHLRRVTVISHGSRANNTAPTNTNNYNNGLISHHNHHRDHYTRHLHHNTNSRNRKPLDARENGHVGLSVGVGIGSSEDSGGGGTRPGLRSNWDPEAGWMGVGRVAPPTGRPRQQIGRLSLQWIDPKTGEKKILWKEIDKASRVVFPLMFLLFMLIYFPILVSRAF